MSDAEREALDIEAASIVRAIEHTTNAASFAGEKLFDSSISGDVGNVSVEDGGETSNYTLADVGRGLSLSADAALIDQIASQAAGDLATMRGEIGASIAYDLEPRARAIETEATNLSAARSIIMDTDYAGESAAHNRLSVLADAARASLVIANAQPNSVPIKTSTTTSSSDAEIGGLPFNSRDMALKSGPLMPWPAVLSACATGPPWARQS